MVQWPALLLIGSAIASWKVEQFGAALGAQALLGGFETYVFAGGSLVGALWFVANARRVYRWDCGDGPACDLCGGPLGWAHAGKRMYGKQLSDYAKCWNCGRNRPVA